MATIANYSGIAKAMAQLVLLATYIFFFLKKKRQEWKETKSKEMVTTVKPGDITTTFA